MSPSFTTAEAYPAIIHDREPIRDRLAEMFVHPVGLDASSKIKTLAETNLTMPYTLATPRRFKIDEISVQLFRGGKLLSCFDSGGVYSRTHVMFEIDQKYYLKVSALDCIDRAAIFPGAALADASIFLAAVESLRRPLPPKDLWIEMQQHFHGRIETENETDATEARMLLRGLYVVPLV
jgi:hypothetical protein